MVLVGLRDRHLRSYAGKEPTAEDPAAKAAPRSTTRKYCLGRVSSLRSLGMKLLDKRKEEEEKAEKAEKPKKKKPKKT